jgi:tetratricopeptide (TPR) repeat protein
MSAIRKLDLTVILAAGAACVLAAAAPPAACADSAAANAWIATAREAAQASDHDTAIKAFEYAMEADPSRRSALLREYADQLTYGGRGDEAIPLYRELLAAQGLSADEQTRARRGLALALSWTDQQQPALREYQALVAQNPADLDALRSVARVQSWQGQHRRAVEQLEAFLADHPHDSEGVAMLAQTLDWMGRPDRAKALLRDQLAAVPGDANAQRLLDEIERDDRPETFFDYSESHQSDNLRITGWGVRQDLTLNDGLTSVGPRFHTYLYDSEENKGLNGFGVPVDASDIFVYRPGLQVRHRVNDSFEWNGFGGVDVIEVRRGEDGAPFIYDTWLTYWASDLLRFDVGSSRSTFDNALSLRQGITATFANASFDVTPDEKTRFTGRFRWGDYEKNDEQTWWQAEAERRVWNDPRTHFALRYTGMDFKKQADKYNGYFNPQGYHSGEARLRTYDELFPDFWYHVEASAGVEDQHHDDAKFIWSAAGGVSYWFTDWLELALQYGYFSSKTGASGGSSGGFDRGTGSLTLRTRW